MTAQPGFTPHVAHLGQGPRKALALHCTMAFSGAWAGLARIMDDELTLIAPDMPSHGRSADWDGVSSFADTVFDASVAQLHDGPVDVIGHSFGAVTALRMAVESPHNIRSLILIEPVFFAVAKADAPETIADHDKQALAFTTATGRGDSTAAARAFNRMWSDGPAWPDLPERTRAAMVRAIHVVPDTFGFIYDAELGLMNPGNLDQVRIPTLLMRGEHAVPAVCAVNDGLERRMPNAQQAVISGAGHMAPISHPQATADLMRPFLAHV